MIARDVDFNLGFNGSAGAGGIGINLFFESLRPSGILIIG
jgi:hypothetical protein